MDYLKTSCDVLKSFTNTYVGYINSSTQKGYFFNNIFGKLEQINKVYDDKYINYNKFNILNKFFATIGCYYVTKLTYKSVIHTFDFKFNRISFLRKIPYFNSYINKKISDTNSIIRNELKIKEHNFITVIPKKGYDIQQLTNLQNIYKSYRKYDYNEGKISGTVYYGNDEEYNKLLINSFNEFIYSNPLHPDVFPDIRIMETEVVSIICNLFNGNKTSCGNITSGGTESILLACKTYRDWGKYTKNINKPEIIIGESAHASFNKAGEYFGIKLVTIPIDIETGKLNIYKMKKAITKNTVCIVGSAPSFAHGVIDDIDVMSDIAKKNNIGLHVDCCLGGFILPFLCKNGYYGCKYDFILDGVTSISADMHKYGYTLKGSSIVMYRNTELRKYQYYVNTDWNGGIYATPTIAGSKSGALIAVTWTSILYHGMNGYFTNASNIVKLRQQIVNSVLDIEGLIIIGTPVVSVIAFRSEKFDIYNVASKMNSFGWNLNILQNPPAFHICLTKIHVKQNIKDLFVNNLKTSIEYAIKNPKSKKNGTCAIYGMTTKIGDKNIIREVAYSYMDALTSI